MVPVLAMLHVRGRLGRVRGGGRMGIGIVHRSGATRESGWLDEGIRVDRWPDGHGGILPRRDVRRTTAGHSRYARSLAVYIDVGHHSRHSTDSHSSFSPRIHALAGKEKGRDLKTAELRRIVPSRVAQDNVY